MEDYCEKEDLMESEDEGMSWLLQLNAEIKGITDSEDAVKSLPTSLSQSAPMRQVDSEPSGETGAGSCGRTIRRGRGSSAHQRSGLSSRKAPATEREWSEYIQF